MNFWFVSHNFRSQYARKSVKDSIDADFDLVFNKTLSQPKRMSQWVGAQGWPKVAKISKTCPHCDVTSRKPPPKMKNVFFLF